MSGLPIRRGNFRRVAVRVLWVVKGLGPGGAERLLTNLARRHDSREFQIECAYVLPWKDHLAGELEDAGVVTHCVSRTRSDPRWPLALTRLIRSGDFDVVHVHSPLPGSVARVAALSASPRPMLMATEHNRWSTHRWPTRLVNSLTSRLDTVDLAVTDEVRSSMTGPARRRARVVRHGVDVEAVASSVVNRAAVRAELGLGADEFVAGTAANFRPQKDYPTLLAAARRLVDDGVPVRIVAVGQGPQENEIRALRDDLGLQDDVLLTGFRRDAVDVLAACDAFVLASAWEGLPVAVMEATAIGLPVVCTAVGGMAEQFTDGVDALLVPPGDPDALARALERVQGDEELRTRLGGAARLRAADFDVGAAAAELEDVYRSFGRPAATTRSDRSRRGSTEPMPEIRPAATTRSDRSRSGSTEPMPEIRPATERDHPEIIQLLGSSLGGAADGRRADLFRWKHVDNRFGPSPMWVATDEGRIVAFRALLRWEFVRGGETVRAVRAVDTATHPDHQGRGLFRRLTLHGLAEMKRDGVDWVFNTPNDQSRPGYLSMGWREVGRLPAAVHFTSPTGLVRAARSRVPAERWSEPLDVGVDVEEWLAGGGPAGRWGTPTDVRDIRTALDEDYLAWRFPSTLLGYRVVEDDQAAAVVRLRRRGTSTELVLAEGFGPQREVDRVVAAAARAAEASYTVRLGAPQMSSMVLRLPGGGPVLTWRGVCTEGMPPLPNWSLTMGDVELF